MPVVTNEASRSSTKQPGVKPKAKKKPATTNAAPVLPFKIGADPEFLAFYGHRSVHANELFSTFLKGHHFAAMSSGFQIGESGNIGWDGHSSTGEMRPSAANTPEALTKNIGDMLESVHKVLPFIDFSALSIGSPVGGHIHVDAPENIVNNEARKSRVLKLVATFLMPIFASEHRICSAYRSAGNYGSPEDMRYQNLGNGVQTLELRGPSAEWTVTPHIARATLAYVAAMWQEIIKRDVALSKTEVALKTKPQITAAYAAILSDYRPVKEGLMKSIAETVRGFEFYERYKEDIEFILNPTAVYAEKEAAGWNLMNGWGLTKEVTPKKKDLMSAKKSAAGAKKVNMQLLDTSFSVSYNNDYNVGLFSEALTERIAGLGWKLKKEYFLFGLKKGIEGFLVNDPGTKKFMSIPNNVDHPVTIALTDKMRQKYGAQARTQMVRIDPKTGKTRVGFNDVILIGLPYGLRQEKDIKSFINLIWSIEKDKLELKSIDQFPQPDPKASGSTEETDQLEPLLRSQAASIDPKAPSRFGGTIEESLGGSVETITAAEYRVEVLRGETVDMPLPPLVWTPEQLQLISRHLFIGAPELAALPTFTQRFLQSRCEPVFLNSLQHDTDRIIVEEDMDYLNALQSAIASNPDFLTYSPNATT